MKRQAYATLKHMTAIPFEYEERYKVTDLEAARQALAAAGFEQTNSGSQTDHWFIPKRINSPEEQTRWFDYEKGYAVRVREEITMGSERTILTAKQLLTPGDHSAMANHESVLTVAGVRRVLLAVGAEFNGLVQTLAEREDDASLTYAELKRSLEQAGRKEYITLYKERITFRNPSMPEVVVDVDAIPALRGTGLGYYASIELEYTGGASIEDARSVVREASKRLGYEQQDILAKALPGQAIPYLAKF